jgi:hypothetical protein
MRKAKFRLFFPILCVVVYVGSAEISLAQQAPGWSRGQQLAPITYEECLRRASLALQAESYRIDYAAGAFAVGVKGVHTGVIMCNAAPEGNTWVNIVVASNGEGGGSEREKLQAQMQSPGNAGGGGTSCQGNGYSITIDPNVIAPGGTITVRVAVPGGDLPYYSWVGMFTPSLGPWQYLKDLKPNFTRNFIVPDTRGKYEIRVLLDSGYDNIATTCIFTVQ